jgi:hypothetical protein
MGMDDVFEKEYIYVPKKLAVMVKSVTEPEEYERTIIKYMEEVKGDLRLNIESLDEDVTLFKAFMIEAKKRFKEAKEAQLKESYELWESYEQELGVIRNRVDSFKNELRPLIEDLKEINSLFSQIKTYDISKLCDVIERYSSLSKDNKEMMDFLIKEFRS